MSEQGSWHWVFLKEKWKKSAFYAEGCGPLELSFPASPGFLKLGLIKSRSHLMSLQDAAECLNMESADFAHQAEEGLWDQNRVSKDFILINLKEKKLPGLLAAPLLLLQHILTWLLLQQLSQHNLSDSAPALPWHSWAFQLSLPLPKLRESTSWLQDRHCFSPHRGGFPAFFWISFSPMVSQWLALNDNLYKEDIWKGRVAALEPS